MADIARIWRQIGQIAAGQHGNITRPQLLALGVGKDAIQHLITTGRLYRVLRGVYCVGRPPVKPIERAAACVLACGDRAALSHGSAMTLWGFWKHWDEPFELTVASHRRPAGVRTHRSSTLLRRDVTTQHGIRVTGPARTLLDIAPRIQPKSLARVINESRRAHLLTLSALADVAGRNPSHPGARLLGPHLEHPHNPTRSELEDDFLAFCRRYALPTPKINTVLHGYEVDAYFEAERLIVELDGWSFHCDRAAFEGDRERDATMLLHGIATVRITWERRHHDPDHEAARLHRILEGRRVHRLGG